MTAPTEPLVMSLEEALLHLHASDWWLEPSRAGDGWVVHDWSDITDEIGIRGAGATWSEAVSIAFGRPVVARDPAAELRAALVDILEYHGGADSPLEDEHVMSRARAALAATEGEE